MMFSPCKLEPPSASQHRINLYEAGKHHKHHELIAKDVSLQDVYDKYVKDGNILYSMQPLKKDMAKEFKDAEEHEFPEEHKNYSFATPREHRVSLQSPQKGYQFGGLRNIIFNESSPVSHYRISMDRAYQFIEGGSPIEVRIR